MKVNGIIYTMMNGKPLTIATGAALGEMEIEFPNPPTEVNLKIVDDEQGKRYIYLRNVTVRWANLTGFGAVGAAKLKRRKKK